MLKSAVSAAAIAVMVAYTPCLRAADAPAGEIIFADNFDRANADKVDNGWQTGDLVSTRIKDGAAFFPLDDGPFAPAMTHAFPAQEKGKFSVSFTMDWLRESEGNWAFYIQLGNSAAMQKKIETDRQIADGVAVNLVWGGGDAIDYADIGSFGYVKSGKFKKLAIVNDVDTAKSVIEHPVVTIEVDLDASTYSVTLNGTIYDKLPFDATGPIDSIRFMAHGCSESGFSKSAIDNVTVSKAK